MDRLHWHQFKRELQEANNDSFARYWNNMPVFDPNLRKQVEELLNLPVALSQTPTEKLPRKHKHWWQR